MEQLIQQIAPAIMVAVLTAVGGIMWRLMTILKPLEDFMKETKAKLQEGEDRHDIHDNLWTLQLKKSVNSKLIAKGHRGLPEV